MPLTNKKETEALRGDTPRTNNFNRSVRNIGALTSGFVLALSQLISSANAQEKTKGETRKPVIPIGFMDDGNVQLMQDWLLMQHAIEQTPLHMDESQKRYVVHAPKRPLSRMWQSFYEHVAKHGVLEEMKKELSREGTLALTSPYLEVRFREQADETICCDVTVKERVDGYRIVRDPDFHFAYSKGKISTYKLQNPGHIRFVLTDSEGKTFDVWTRKNGVGSVILPKETIFPCTIKFLEAAENLPEDSQKSPSYEQGYQPTLAAESDLPS